MAETSTVEQPWAVRFRDGMWEVTCSDGSLGGRFPREGDARTFADVAGPGPMTIVSVATLERLRAIEQRARAFDAPEARYILGELGR